MKMDGESSNMKNKLFQWRFSQYRKYVLLPIDESHDQVKQIKNVVYSGAIPRPLNTNVRLVCACEEPLINILDMDLDIINHDAFLDFISGKKFPQGALPVAHRYGGHQYGLWVGQLGDGRAHIIGEYVNRLGERWQVQLKGLGRTPYSRVFDGRAALRSCIRELIASEALYHLGVPTIRVAALAVSDEMVIRDKHYSGRPHREKAAVLMRMSPSWLRFGSFEILARCGEIQVLRQLADFVIQEYFPDIHTSDENKYIRLFSEIAQRTLDLVAMWQARLTGETSKMVVPVQPALLISTTRFGYTHGLLNTDNMSLLGLTLGYGPFGFLDSYDGGFVSNSSDREGRYSFMKQPDAVVWNISQLGTAFNPLLSTTQQAHMTHLIKTFDTYCKNKILATFLMKIGLIEERWGDEQLVEKLLDMMQHTGADFTATFRQLAELEPSEMASELKIAEKWCLKRLSSHSSWCLWLEQYRDRLEKESVNVSSTCPFEEERRRRMLSVNPQYVPRNWLMQEAIIDAEKDDFAKVNFLLQVIRNPYEVQQAAEIEGFSRQPPLWAYTLKISCSS